VPPSGIGQEGASIVLNKYTSDVRVQERELLGVSTLCVQDYFPQLDIGDSLEVIGHLSLTAEAAVNGDTNGIEKQTEETKTSAAEARQELLDALSGHTILASFLDSPDQPGYAP
jgi:serine/tyrosine/threonine adenylyltransferase